MQKILSLLSFLLLTTLLSCSTAPSYHASAIHEHHDWYGIAIAEIQAEYPVFEEQYHPLNAAIEAEVAQWCAQYDAICAVAEEDCNRDADLATFHRYLTATYTVAQHGNKISVTFDVRWDADPGNSEEAYIKTLTLDTTSGMVCQTLTQTSRIYQ